MRKVVDVYLAVFCLAGVALLLGFTLARAVPPRWVFAIILVGLLAALGGVLWLGRHDS